MQQTSSAGRSSRPDGAALLVASDAAAAAADQLRRDLVRDLSSDELVEVVLHCTARHAAIRVLIALPADWALADAIAALEQAPPRFSSIGRA